MQAPLSTTKVRTKIKAIIGEPIEPDRKFIEKCFECIQGDLSKKNIPKYWEQTISDEAIREMALREIAAFQASQSPQYTG